MSSMSNERLEAKYGRGTTTLDREFIQVRAEQGLDKATTLPGGPRC